MTEPGVYKLTAEVREVCKSVLVSNIRIRLCRCRQGRRDTGNPQALLRPRVQDVSTGVQGILSMLSSAWEGVTHQDF